MIELADAIRSFRFFIEKCMICLKKNYWKKYHSL